MLRRAGEVLGQVSGAGAGTVSAQSGEDRQGGVQDESGRSGQDAARIRLECQDWDERGAGRGVEVHVGEYMNVVGGLFFTFEK